MHQRCIALLWDLSWYQFRKHACLSRWWLFSLTPKSLAWTGTSQRNLSTLNSGTHSISMPLEIGQNRVTLFSTSDGRYAFSITRAAWDVSAPMAIGVDAQANSMLLTLTKSSTGYVYSATVPWLTVQMQLSVPFLMPGSVSLTSDVQVNPIPLMSGVWTAPIPLIPSTMQTFVIRSALDGNISVVLTRRPPDIAAVTFQLLSSTGANWSIAPATFSNERNVYAGEVPYAVISVFITITYATPNSLSVQLNGGQPPMLFSSGTAGLLQLCNWTWEIMR